MPSPFRFESLFTFSLKAFSTTIIFIAIFLGYQDKIVGFSSFILGLSVIAQTSSEYLRVNN